MDASLLINLSSLLSKDIYNRFWIEYSDNKVRIANAVCKMLNHEGGVVFCVKKNGSYVRKKDAEEAGKGIYNYFQKSISNFPEQKVKVSVNGKNNNYMIVIDVSRSESIHVLKASKTKVGFDENYFYSYYNQFIQQYRDQINGKLWDNLKQWYDSIEKWKEIKIAKQNENIRDVVKYVDGYFKIGDFASGSKFYKYMSLENALQCFIGSNLWFVEPTEWQDKFENYFYGATINGEKCSNNNPLLYATCVTNSKDSESAWKIYSYNTQGLASRCVELTINRKKFREQLLKAKFKESDSKRYKPLSNYYDIYEGEVLYKDEQYIVNLSQPKIKDQKMEKPNEAFKAYFDAFSFENYLNLMLLKRKAFQHESEIRIFIVPKKWKGNSKCHSHLDIKLEWGEVVEGLRYDCNCSKLEKTLLLDALKKVLKLKKSAPLPTGFKFEPYDVYDAPAPPTITIKKNSDNKTMSYDYCEDQLIQKSVADAN